jgi:hypothetical protein
MKRRDLRTYLDAIKPERPYWKNKNRYYYGYLKSFVDFLVPSGKRVLEVPFGTLRLDKQDIPDLCESYDYVVASDVLGYVRDIQQFFEDAAALIPNDGRVVITQYSALWEPILRFASALRLRMPSMEQNWISHIDLKNFASLAGLETVKSGTKLLFPKYVPLLSVFLNRFVANLWPFTRLGVFHYLVLRKQNSAGQTLGGMGGVKPSLSVVVPARNEAGTIEKIVRLLPELGSFTEIIFVEGNSTDNTWQEINRVADAYKGKRRIQIAQQQGKGKGDAVRKGFEMATGDVLTIYDADMTVPPEEVEHFYKTLSTRKGDFINGSRLVYPLEEESMRMLNLLANKFFGFAFSAILGQPIKDTLCGSKMIWRKDYGELQKGRSFFGDFDPFGDFDLLFGAAKLNLKIIDLPVHYQRRTYGTTNISRWKHGWLLLKMTIFAARKLKLV